MISNTRLDRPRRDAADAGLGVEAVVGAIMAGTLKVPIAGSYALDNAEEMFAALTSRQTGGKLILRVAD